MSSIVIGPLLERIDFLIQSAELIANTTQELICPVDGYIDLFEVVVNKTITTGGTLTLNAGGAVYNVQSYLDTTSFPGAAQGDTPYLPAVNTLAGQNFAATAPAAPGIVQVNNHGLVPGQVVTLTGTLPTGFSTATNYFVSSYGFTPNNFNLATSIANAWSGVSITASGSASTSFSVVTGAQGVIPVTNCVLTVASSAAAGTEYIGTRVPNGDPTNLVKQGQLMTIVPASFATAGEVQGVIRFRSNR
jgi:hypothetical protein